MYKFNSIKEIDAWSYMQFSKHLHIYRCCSLSSFADMQKDNALIIQLAKAEKFQDMARLLDNRALAYWKSTELSTEIALAYGWLHKDGNSNENAYEIALKALANTELMIQECYFTNEQFDNEISSIKEVAKEEKQDVHRLVKDWSSVELDDFESLDKLKQKQIEEISIKSFNPSSRSNFMEDYDINLTKWHTMLGVTQKEMSEITMQEFLIKNHFFEKANK